VNRNNFGRIEKRRKKKKLYKEAGKRNGLLSGNIEESPAPNRDPKIPLKTHSRKRQFKGIYTLERRLPIPARHRGNSHKKIKNNGPGLELLLSHLPLTAIKHMQGDSKYTTTKDLWGPKR